MPSYRRFPSDDEFHREIKVRNLYNFRSRSYWLRRLENHDRKERVPVDEYTIEHILPQKENLSLQWRDALGPDWQRVQETWLHTLGNLTLTGYNAEYSDRPFAEKRDMKGGFKTKITSGLLRPRRRKLGPTEPTDYVVRYSWPVDYGPCRPRHRPNRLTIAADDIPDHETAIEWLLP